MPGMNSGINVNDPTVVAAFKAVLLHQGLIALLIFALLGLAWISVRAWPPFARNSAAQAPGTAAPVQAEPACCACPQTKRHSERGARWGALHQSNGGELLSTGAT